MRESRVKDSRRQLVPFFSTISLSNISTKVSTTNPPEMFVEMFEREIVEKKGTSCRRLVKERAKTTTCVRAVLKGVRAIPPSRVKERAKTTCVRAVLKGVRAGWVKGHVCQRTFGRTPTCFGDVVRTVDSNSMIACRCVCVEPTT